ncbi:MULTISPECIES: CHAT domain-containing protein [unclassified Corallococcus]|uniref:CHAT domain-containing protein n=1 Tax=unclassified Corallococcus TaxID=2685029 RepID=UPI001F5DC5B6|nr:MULTISPECIES: CHAT domain-containing protein [unclassified Corallococcus]WAS86790.1 CHAT domain-containing protein [Corallococcus sp. NCRR]
MEMRRLRVWRWGGFTLSVGLALCAPTRAAAESSALARCEEGFDAHPETSDAAMCFFRSAQGQEARDEARRRLQALIARHPERPWLMLVLGHMELPSDPALAEVSYRRAALAFRSQGDAEGEVMAGINVRNALGLRGQTEEAHQWVLRVGEVARASGNPWLEVRALILEAAELSDLGQDLGRAWRLLKRAEGLAFPDGTDGLKKQLLVPLAAVSVNLGRFDEALDVYGRLAELAERTKDASTEARVRFALANLAWRRLDARPDAGGRAALLRLGREALAASERAGSKVLETSSLRLVAELLGDGPGERSEAEDALGRCIDISRETGMTERRITCLWTRAERRAAVDAAAAWRDVDEALALAAEHDNPLYLASVWRTRATVAFRTRPLPEALGHAERALDAVEVLRQWQRDASSQAELFSNWASDYHRLAGFTLEAGETSALPPREALERAFAVSERLRARTLFEALVASRALPTQEETPEQRKARDGVLRNLSALQRRLLDPALSESERTRLLGELQELERRERELRPATRRRELPSASRTPTGARPEQEREAGTEAAHAELPFASLAATEQSLGEEEALLVFLAGVDHDLVGERAGGAWVMAVTREGTRAYRIPERARLRPSVALLSGLIERRDGSEAGAAAALYAQLLAPALRDLPSKVSRLLLVPDGPLHDLPFAALREHADAPPLMARYELARVPSASLLHYWRAQPARPPEGEALVLADPDRKDTLQGTQVASARGGMFLETANLGALPEARREGRTVSESLEDTAVKPRLLMGAEASEHALKASRWDVVRILHVAAHAVVDVESPERSALVLAPGEAGEDGLLQPREIAELRLRDALVVLSSCRGASGALLAGEGVLSLSRAFFESGARAVVASLWPMRDAEAAALLERYYQHLAEGQSAASALRNAQRDAWEDGEPAAMWAGLGVMGDATLVPVRPAAGGMGRGVLLGVSTGAGLLALGLWGFGMRRRKRGSGQAA